VGALKPERRVTVPATPSASPPPQSVSSTAAPPPPPPPVSPVSFPLDWLLANAGAPIQYRSVVDVARLTEHVGDDFATLPLTYRSALMLAATQSADGTWNRAMLTTPSPRAEHFAGVGTINAVRRLLEYGWPPDAPTLVHARRPLFRLLAGTIIGLFAMLFVRRDLTAAYVVLCGAVTGIVAGLISAPISAGVFSGVTGAGTDFLVAAFRQGGADVYRAALGQSLISDPIDKIVTYFVVFLILAAMARRTKARFPQGERLIETVPEPEESPA
jgi:large-conductance mechanosensitive channel